MYKLFFTFWLLLASKCRANRPEYITTTSDYCRTRQKSSQKIISDRAKSLKAAIVAHAKEHTTSAPVLVSRQIWKPGTPPLAISKLLNKGSKFIYSVKFSQSFGLSISPSDLMNSRHQDTLHLTEVTTYAYF